MKLLLIFDHRFMRTRDGNIFAHNVYHYSFFANRYLRVFDEVSILARVADRSDLESPPVEQTEGPGVRIIPLPDWKGAGGFLRSRTEVLRSAMPLISGGSALIMIAPGGLASVVFGRLRGLGHPIALEVVGDPWDSFQPGASDHPLRPVLRRWLSRALRRQCAGACAVSYVTNKALQKRYPCFGYSAGISDVVLPDSAFVPTSRSYGPARPKTIICVAGMNKYKGHDVLLDALKICQEMAVHLDLILVGGGALRDQVEGRAKQLGIKKQIRFAGQLPAGEAVRQELDRADLLVLPSRTEGMPRALLEAMARGLPCIASKVGGVPEVLPSDAMVCPGDAQALALKLKAVVENAGWLSEMSHRNLQRAADYKEEVLAPKRLEFYEYIRKVNADFSSVPHTFPSASRAFQ